MNQQNDIIFYTSSTGNVKIKVIFNDETFWLTQKSMAELFGVKVPAISKHLSNIYTEGELLSSTTISKMETVVNRGFRGEVAEEIDFYNLDAIIAPRGGWKSTTFGDKKFINSFMKPKKEL